MEWTNLFVEVLKLSPFVAALLFFLMTVWKSMQKKDAVLMDTMKEHQASMIQMHEKNILAQNNAADANRQQAESVKQLAGAVVDMKGNVIERLEAIEGRLPKNGVSRKLPVHPVTPTAA